MAKRKVVDKCRNLINMAFQSKDGSKFKHFFTSRDDLRERVLRPGIVWGLMTRTIATEFDSEKGRASVFEISQVSFKKYFSFEERALLEGTSQLNR